MLVDFSRDQASRAARIDENLDHNLLSASTTPILPLLVENGERVFSSWMRTRRLRTSPA